MLRLRLLGLCVKTATETNKKKIQTEKSRGDFKDMNICPRRALVHILFVCCHVSHRICQNSNPVKNHANLKPALRHPSNGCLYRDPLPKTPPSPQKHLNTRIVRKKCFLKFSLRRVAAPPGARQSPRYSHALYILHI